MDDGETSSGSFPQLKEIDDVLKCGICYETLTVPVITACSHSFCSICIRRWLTTKQICPSCSEECFEASLRKNTIVSNILDAVQNVKKKLFGKIHFMPSSSPDRSRSLGITPPKNDERDRKPKIFVKKTPPHPKEVHSSPHPKNTVLPPQTPLVHGSSKVERTPGGERPQLLDDDDRSPAIKVPCPVCNVMMAQRLVYNHLDRCSTKSRTSESSKIASKNSGENFSPKNGYAAKKNKSSTSGDDNPPLERIKKMVYNLMSDKQLKAELKKYGLSIQGDRRTLSSRLQRFVIMHNAECDSDRPRSLLELKNLLEKEEKAMSSSSGLSTFSQMFKKTNNPEDIESAQRNYRIENKTSFNKLIEVAKKNAKTTKPLQECVTLSDTEDDPDPLPSQSDLIPATEAPLAMCSRKVESDDNSDFLPGSSMKTPKNQRNASKNIKRKCIESESEEEDDEDAINKKLRKEVREETISPVLSCKTPARMLRSQTVQNRTAKKQRVTPQSTRNSKKDKALPPKQKGGGKKQISSSDDSEEDIPVVKRNKLKEEERLRSPTPDLFVSPESSVDIPCGQKRNNKIDNDALDALVEMIDNDDSGSTTDFED